MPAMSDLHTTQHGKDTTVARTYDADGLRRRAACLCFRDRSEQEILLVSSSHHRNRWIVPGGGIDPGEEPTVAAEREVLEEAGARGLLDRLLGIFENQEKSTRTWVYVFYVSNLEEHWLESKMFDRKRQWFPLGDAKTVLSHKLETKYLDVVERAKVKVMS